MLKKPKSRKYTLDIHYMLNIREIIRLVDIHQGIWNSSCSGLEETPNLSTVGTWKTYKYYFTKNNSINKITVDKSLIKRFLERNNSNKQIYKSSRQVKRSDNTLFEWWGCIFTDGGGSMLRLSVRKTVCKFFMFTVIWITPFRMYTNVLSRYGIRLYLTYEIKRNQCTNMSTKIKISEKCLVLNLSMVRNGYKYVQ